MTEDDITLEARSDATDPYRVNWYATIHRFNGPLDGKIRLGPFRTQARAQQRAENYLYELRRLGAWRGAQ
jgi:hypothetical protein